MPHFLPPQFLPPSPSSRARGTAVPRRGWSAILQRRKARHLSERGRSAKVTSKASVCRGAALASSPENCLKSPPANCLGSAPENCLSSPPENCLKSSPENCISLPPENCFSSPPENCPGSPPENCFSFSPGNCFCSSPENLLWLPFDNCFDSPPEFSDPTDLLALLFSLSLLLSSISLSTSTRSTTSFPVSCPEVFGTEPGAVIRLMFRERRRVKSTCVGRKKFFEEGWPEQWIKIVTTLQRCNADFYLLVLFTNFAGIWLHTC